MRQARQYVCYFLLYALPLVFGSALVSPNLGMAIDTQSWGGDGGTPFRDQCPNGSYLVGLKGNVGSWINRIAPVCARWLLAQQTFGPRTVGPFHGRSTDINQREQYCGMLGLTMGAIRSWDLRRLSSDNFLEFIAVRCTSLGLPTATRPLGFVFGGPITKDQGTNLIDQIGNLGKDAGDSFSIGCPPGELAIGIHGSAGQDLNSIGLICGPRPPNLLPPATNVNPHAMKPYTPATKVNPLATAPERVATGMNPLTAAPVPTADMFTITNPVWKHPLQSIQQGQLVVAATKPKIGMTQVSELKFEWLDAPPDWCGPPRDPSGRPLNPCPPYVNQFAIDTPLLDHGYQVDPGVTRGHTGRWEVRVRASGKAVPGPWSFPVQFHLFVTQPTQSQKQAPPPIMQQAPLPSSSVTQPSPIQQNSPLPSSVTQAPTPPAVPQTAPLPPPSVMPAPVPSSAPAQMNRSSSMFTTRGVDEKEVGSEPPKPAEPTKKP